MKLINAIRENEALKKEKINFYANPNYDGQSIVFYDYGQFAIFEETNSNTKGVTTPYATPIIWLPIEDDDNDIPYESAMEP